MLTSVMASVTVPVDSDDWTPPGWGTDEENAAEAAKFSTWTRGLRPVPSG